MFIIKSDVPHQTKPTNNIIFFGEKGQETKMSQSTETRALRVVLKTENNSMVKW